MEIGYHCSHEQFSPSTLLNYVELAEKSGFDFALSSDHFHPWLKDQGHSGFAWSWLGAAMSRTTFPFGIVNCPLYRYNPAIIAQAATTLDEMFPERFWLSIGTGQALNEAILGKKWPYKALRNLHLKEAAEIIQCLWKGEKVTRHEAITIEEARLYTLPKSPIALYGAAITPETTAYIAPWAQGLITLAQPEEKMKKVIDAWKTNGGDNKPMIVKIQLSYDASESEALEGAFDQWRSNVFGGEITEDLKTPEQFAMAAKFIKPEDMKKYVHISSNLDAYQESISNYISLGFNKIILHNVNKNQEGFIRDFGEKLLPFFKDKN